MEIKVTDDSCLITGDLDLSVSMHQETGDVNLLIAYDSEGSVAFPSRVRQHLLFLLEEDRYHQVDAILQKAFAEKTGRAPTSEEDLKEVEDLIPAAVGAVRLKDIIGKAQMEGTCATVVSGNRDLLNFREDIQSLRELLDSDTPIE